MSGPSPPGAGPSPVGPSPVGPSQAGPSPNAPPKKAKSAAALYEFKALSATRRVWFGAAVGGVSGVSYGLRECRPPRAFCTPPTTTLERAAPHSRCLPLARVLFLAARPPARPPAAAVDSYREVDSRKWKLADAKSVDFAAKNTLKMSVWFAGYFGLFQVLKYGAMVARCAEAPAAAAAAAAAGCWLLLSRPLC